MTLINGVPILTSVNCDATVTVGCNEQFSCVLNMMMMMMMMIAHKLSLLLVNAAFRKFCLFVVEFLLYYLRVIVMSLGAD